MLLRVDQFTAVHFLFNEPTVEVMSPTRPQAFRKYIKSAAEGTSCAEVLFVYLLTYLFKK